MRNICPDTARLTALREGWLGEEERERLRHHLEVCPECRAAHDDLESILDFIAFDLGGVEPPPGGFEALLDATLKMRDRIKPLPRPTANRWRRTVIVAAAILIVAVTSISILDLRQTSPTVTAEAAEEGDIPDWQIEEHARASDLVPFSDSATLIVLANQGRR